MRILPLGTLWSRISTRLQVRRHEIERRQGILTSDPVSKADWASVSSRARLEIGIHPHAGLGHQVASWMSGYLWAQDLGVAFEGGEITRDSVGLFKLESPQRRQRVLVRRHTFRLRSVADERGLGSLEFLRTAMFERLSRSNCAMNFRLALDQPRWSHVGATERLRQAVLEGALGSKLRDLEAGPDYIAIHVRRAAWVGDITEQTDRNRWVGLDWYVKLIKMIRAQAALSSLPIKVFSLGDEAEFSALRSLAGVDIHLNGRFEEDFVEMAAARLLVAAPSSFSMNAGLVSQSAVGARVPWWHEVPNEGRWFHLSQTAIFAHADLERALKYSDNSDQSLTTAEGDG